jgi:hypothetical protein
VLPVTSSSGMEESKNGKTRILNEVLIMNYKPTEAQKRHYQATLDLKNIAVERTKKRKNKEH